MRQSITRRRGGGRLVTAGLAAAVLAAMTAPAASAQSIRLEYKLRPETTYDQIIDMTMHISMEMAGLPEEQAAMAEALTQGMTQEMVMTMAMELGALDSDGAMPLEMRIVEMQAAMVVAGQRMASPAKVTPGTSLMSGRITPRGKMVEMSVEGVEGVSGDLVDRILQFIPELPSVELAVGQSFDVPMSVDVPIPTADIRMEGKAVYTLRSVDGSLATFDLTQDFSLGLEGGEGADVGGMNLRMKGGGSGSAVFDLDEGIFSEILFDMEMDADMKADPAAMKASDEGGQGAGPMTMKMKASGPVRVTVTRRGT